MTPAKVISRPADHASCPERGSARQIDFCFRVKAEVRQLPGDPSYASGDAMQSAGDCFI